MIGESLLLGLLQGLSEFLPISSSGHLALGRALLGLQEVPLLFDVLLHIATLAAILIVFRRPIALLLRTAGRAIIGRADRTDRHALLLIAAIAVATITTAGPGLLVGRLVPTIELRLVGVGFLITALVLVVGTLVHARRDARGQSSEQGLSSTYRQSLAHPHLPASIAPNESTNAPMPAIVPIALWKAALVGLAQGVAVLPGISRSGITISIALLLAMSRRQAGEFSFLIAIPATLGALLLTLRQGEQLSLSLTPVAVLVGALAAFVVGFLALLLVVRILRRGRLILFAPYLVLAGVLVIVLSSTIPTFHL